MGSRGATHAPCMAWRPSQSKCSLNVQGNETVAWALFPFPFRPRHRGLTLGSRKGLGLGWVPLGPSASTSLSQFPDLHSGANNPGPAELPRGTDSRETVRLVSSETSGDGGFPTPLWLWLVSPQALGPARWHREDEMSRAVRPRGPPGQQLAQHGRGCSCEGGGCPSVSHVPPCHRTKEALFGHGVVCAQGAVKTKGFLWAAGQALP